MNPIVSICEDFTGLVTRHPELLDTEDRKRGLLSSWSGANTYYNGNKSIKVLTDTTGLEDIEDDVSVTTTTFEAIYGYNTYTFDEFGERVIDETFAADPVMTALYNSVYDQTPVDIEGVTVTPPKLIAIPAGWDSSHLTL